MRQTGIIIFIIALIVVIGGLIYWAVSSVTPVEAEPEIVSFLVDQPDLVVETRGSVGSISIFGVPDVNGNGTTTATTTEDILIGEAEMTMSTSGPELVEWRLAIPSEPLQLSAMYAQAYDNEGNEIDRMSLEETGPQEIHRALWVSGAQSSVTLRVGETGTVNGASLTLDGVLSDERPEGQITVSVTFEPETGEAVEATLSNDDEQIEVGEYLLQILSVTPDVSVGEDIAEEDYEVRFLVFRELKL